MKKISIFLTLVSLLVVPLGPAQSFSNATAQSYLLSNSNSPWATMGLAALGTANIPTAHLKSITASAAVDYAAPVLAITALGENPRTFGSTNYVAALKNYHQGGQIGDPALINDDIFGILALISAGEAKTDSAITDAKNFLLANQNADSGWGFAASAGSDTNTTAAAILALIAAGEAKTASPIQNALNYLQSAQNSNGGITYDPQSPYGTASDSSSTAWVIWALNALETNPSSWSKPAGNPTTYLETTQKPQGFFEYQAGSGEDAFSPVTTAYAVIALSGKTLPLRIYSANAGQEFAFRIEGSQNQICAGSTPGPSALDIVKNASLICGFTYNIQNTSYGPYLNQIGSDTAQGLQGWLYFVNYISPSIGAADYVLQSQDEVLWYFGDFDWLPTKLTLDNSKINAGGQAIVTVEELKNNAFSPLEGATMYFGASIAITNASGQAAISPNPGFYQIYAEKTGHVRSNAKLLQVGEVNGEGVSLSVNVEAGRIGGETISFSVNPDFINFGSLQRGEEAGEPITIQNLGSTAISMESVVSGDALFLQNLKIDNSSWENFKAGLASQETKNSQVGISVPGTYNGGSGPKNGTLTFWAIAK